MEQALNDLVNDALFKWVEVTGVDLSKTKFTIRLDGRMSEYDIMSATEELNESRELDETGLTTWMMLRGLTEAYMQDQEFSAFDLVFKPGPIKERLTAMHSLHALLENPLVTELIDDFVGKVRSAAKRFEFKKTDALETLLADKYDLAWVRRDALLSMRKLSVHQFTQGDGDKLPIGLNPNIYEIWNVNSLIRALRIQNIPGVTTVLVRDPEVLHSFFVIAVKNGDNITILTDKDEEEHPAAKRMSRRPDRALQRRAGRHWFPYRLLDLEVTEDRKHLYAKQRNAVVPLNVEALKLATVADLGPKEFVWMMLIAELVREKFWKQNYHTPELSYTGEMVIEPHALVGADGALVKKGLYQPLELPPLKKSDVTSGSTAAQWRVEPTYFHEWMVDRYDGRVPEAVMNVTGEPQRRLLERSQHLVERDFRGEIQTHNVYGQEIRELECLDPQNFGTKDKLEKDRVWAARYNQMKVIQHLAEKEYERENENIKKWLQAAIEKNAEFILNGMARNELILSQYERGPENPTEPLYGPAGSIDTSASWSPEWHLKRENALTLCEGRRYQFGVYPPFRLGGYRREGSRFFCFDRPEMLASIFCEIRVSCPEAIAEVCGVTVAELPWALQHWYGENEPYTGNSILNRCDPVDWILKNPWAQFRIRIGAALSKRAFAARRKALGLPAMAVIGSRTVSD